MDTLLKSTIEAVVNSQYPDMSKEGRLYLEKILVKAEYPKGEIILKEGEVADSIVLVGKGMLRQFYFKNNKDITEHFSYEGCVMICIESFLKQEPTHLMVETIEPVVIYKLPYDVVQRETRIHWEINMFYRKMIEYSLILSQLKADSWRFETAHERYKKLFDNHPEIIRRASMSDIASYLLMSPETLSRVRAEFWQS